VLGASVTILLAACGGGGGESTGSTGQSSPPAATRAEKPLPPNAPMTEVLARNFPPPKPNPDAPPGSRAAIAAGRKACKGKTPVQVREEFIGKAKESGLLNPGQEKMIGEIDHFESQASHSPDFVAGQLAAGVYEATLPEKLRVAGYQGCVYELAQKLIRELKGEGR
jgi:hypothetical protein